MAVEETLTARDVHRMLHAAVKDAGGLRAFASLHGISSGYLSEVMRSDESMGPKIYNALGLIKVDRWIPLKREK